MALITKAVPQFLVGNMAQALAFYNERLGFTTDFVYEDFYACVSRDGASIHLKCAEQFAGLQAYRNSHEHLDAFIAVSGVRELHEELVGRGAPITQPLTTQPWNELDFYVEDPDGHILCFSEPSDAATA